MARPAHLAALLLLAAPPALADGQVEAAVKALRADGSLKVRAQAAIVLGQRGGPEAVAALRGAVAGDAAAAVRLAAVSALGRLGPRAARTTLGAASVADPDAAVRDAAARAVAAMGPVALAVEDAPAPPGLKGDLRSALARALEAAGLRLAEPAEVRVTPAASAEVQRADGKVVVAVKASLSAVDGDGHVELMERAARATFTGAASDARVASATTSAVEAALKGLSEDLAARLGKR
jgi:HEAT repeat protein